MSTSVMRGENIKKKVSVWIISVCLFVFSAAGYRSGQHELTPVEATEGSNTSIDKGVVREIPGREAFNTLASGDELTTSLQFSEVKFLVTDILTDEPELYFIDSNAFVYHWKFFNEVLGWNLSLLDFNTRTYTDFNRRLLAGSVVAHDRYSSTDHPEGIIAIEFWPGDPVHIDDILLAFQLVNQGMKFAAGKIVYHPVGETQVRIYMEEYESFQLGGIPVLLTSDLYSGVDYTALNTGLACGILRDGNAVNMFSPADILVFESIPNDISHVAGIITTIPQTPLSHINLIAIQNGTPNVYIPGFTDSQEYQALLGKYVKLTALPGGYTIKEISYAAAMLWLESVRPSEATILEREISEQRILPIDMIRLDNTSAYGAKAASLGELSWCLPSFSIPDGFAIPFYYYHEFMEYNNLYHLADSIMTLEEFDMGAEERDALLRELRQRIMESEVPVWIADSLSEMVERFEPGISLRCRSSTNNEDLPGWSGAGLYSSFTHHVEEGHISRTVKQVWAGLWTYRAFAERDFYRIDHFSVAMGVLVHPSYRNEIANGVAVTGNIFNPFIPGYYVNVQAGEDMVTNPELESVPEEFIVTEQNITG
ncbi:MAG: PEP/pyruvate-binding domain-containing protein, partial [Candidatus Fermentibacteria bacterium]|nr:PEP/pyruvate-binding domain-containing protein [Candidatus Fermentibacteria bacterium]